MPSSAVIQDLTLGEGGIAVINTDDGQDLDGGPASTYATTTRRKPLFLCIMILTLINQLFKGLAVKITTE